MVFHSRCAAWLRSAVLLVSCAVTGACGGEIPTVLAPEVVAGIKLAHVTSYVPHEKVEVQYLETGVFSLNLAVLMNFGVVNAMGRRESEVAARKLNDATKNVDFRGQLWAAISPVAKESPWLKAAELKMSPTAFTLVTPTRVSGAAALIITTDYFFSHDCQRFVTGSALRFYLQGQSEMEAARNSILYLSDDIGPQGGDEAIPLWIANDGAAYRKAVAESAAESAKMVRYALRTMGGDPPKPLREGTMKGVLKVAIIEETEERIVLLNRENGSFSSLPAKVVEIDDQPSMYSQKRARDAQMSAQAAQNAANEKARYWADVWKTWSAEHPGDPCVSALGTLKSATECVGAACRAPLVLTTAYQKNCRPDADTLISLNRLRRGWEKETGGGTSN